MNTSRLVATAFCAGYVCLQCLPLQAQRNEPAVSAPSALLMEPRTGTILFEKNPHKRLIPASLVKIMTLILTFDYLTEKNMSVQTPITISRNASLIGGRQVYLKEGESMTVEELIKAVAIFSANDAAYALAELVAGTEDRFVDMMNDKAAQLGLTDTQFNNSHGLPDRDAEHNQYTTAYDLAQLARYVYFNYPQVFTYTTVKMDYVRDGAFQLINTNKLLWKRDDVYGLKTGYIRASGFCVVSMAQRDGFNLIAVVMGAKSKNARFAFAEHLFDYGFSSCYYEVVDRLPQPVTVTVLDGVAESVPVVLASPIILVVPGVKEVTMEHTLTMPKFLIAPVKPQQWAGEFTVAVGDLYEKSASLVTAAPVEQDMSISAKVRRFLRR